MDNMPTEEEIKKQQEAEAAAKAAQEAQGSDDEDEAFVKSLLNSSDDDDEDETEEERRAKNKNAEEARKRREAEAKAAKELADSEAAKKAEEEKRAKEAEAKNKEAEAKATEEEKKRLEEEKKNTNALGEQLVDFKKEYPNVDLQSLDADKAFKKFIDGKLLGKKSFTTLYKEYIDMRAEISGTDVETIEKNYRKAESSSGSSRRGSDIPSDVYSEEEMNKIASRIPLMSRSEYAKIEAKIERSIAYHEKK
jgi:hypothetical protein